VLQSPTVWTGKEGIKNIGSLLGNGPLQDKFQQDLMKAGLSDLKTQGMPTDKLTAQAQAGISTMAARSVTATMDWAKNNGMIPPEVKAGFDDIAANSAFAVNLAKTRVDAPVKQQVVPQPAENTVKSETVDAAATRVVGNDKVPTVAASSNTSTLLSTLKTMDDLISQARAAFLSLLTKTLPALVQKDYITQEEWNTVNNEYQAARAVWNSRNKDLIARRDEEFAKLPSSDPDYQKLLQINKTISAEIARIQPISKEIKDLLAILASRIRG
jgi:multidrug resistance efflux pump